jgi:NAD(P)-dependent dehydrogenase (short-subunit alcohol dehydrogenase family)
MISLTVLNVLFARALASLISSSSPVIVNCLNPGYCESGLLRNATAEVLKRYEKHVPHTSEEGARQVIWAAVGGQGREDELKGAYITESNIVEPSDYVLGEQGKAIQDRILVSDRF